MGVSGGCSGDRVSVWGQCAILLLDGHSVLTKPLLMFIPPSLSPFLGPSLLPSPSLSSPSLSSPSLLSPLSPLPPFLSPSLPLLPSLSSPPLPSSLYNWVAIGPMVTSARTAISQKGSVAAHEDFSQKADNVSFFLSSPLPPVPPVSCVLRPSRVKKEADEFFPYLIPWFASVKIPGHSSPLPLLPPSHCHTLLTSLSYHFYILVPSLKTPFSPSSYALPLHLYPTLSFSPSPQPLPPSHPHSW